MQREVQCSTFYYFYSVLGLFDMNKFEAGETVAYYYGSLVYSNLVGNPKRHRTYVEGILDITF